MQHDMELLMPDFERDQHFRRAQIDSGGLGKPLEPGADEGLDIDRTKGMPAAAFATHGKSLAAQLLAVMLHGHLQHAFEIGQRIFPDLENGGDSGDVAQLVEYFRAVSGAVDFDFDDVPFAADAQLILECLQDRPDVLAQQPDKPAANGAALDGDLGKQFDQEQHCD